MLDTPEPRTDCRPGLMRPSMLTHFFFLLIEGSCGGAGYGTT